MKCAACRFADGALEVQSSKALCRRCAGNVARFLLDANEITLAAIWNRTPPLCSQEDQVFEEFKARVDATLSVVDSQAWLDLAHAYAEMGLASDVITAAAHALSREAPPRLAQRSLDLIFGPDARPDALDYVLRAMRITS